MNSSVLAAFVLFALVTSITPGPNNLLLLASGLRHGVRATIPHMAGVSSGFFTLVAAAGLGIGELFAHWPGAWALLKWGAIAYFLWLALAFLHAQPIVSEPRAGERPWGFWQAFAFQAINPKGWLMALGATAAYLPPEAGVPEALVLAALFACIGLPCFSCWAIGGAHMQRYFGSARRQRLFNTAVAVLLLVSLWPML